MSCQEIAMTNVLGLPEQHADRRVDLFGGSGAVCVWDLLGGGAAPPFSAVLACQLEPGASVGAHVQQRDPEIVLCLRGQGVAEVDGTSYPLAPGVVIHLPYGNTLALRNASASEPLDYLIIKAHSP
jgi:quercetin dioxygenase-like cupin family protein